MYKKADIVAANNAIGNWVVTWSIKSAPQTIADNIVVSEIGEH